MHKVEGKVLLSGASGLVGRAAGRTLLEGGSAFVAIDREADRIDGFDILDCDVANGHRLHELASRHRFAAIIHCAAYSGPLMAPDNPAAVIKTNIGGTTNLLEIARIHRIARFVFCSSVSAVGPNAEPVTEDIRLAPTSVYGATKAACEHLISVYRHSFGLETACLRLAAVYGPERQAPCVLGDMIRNAVEGCPTRIAAGGDFPTQYIHVEDAARALLCAAAAPALPREIYNVGAGKTMPLAAVAALVAEVLPQADIEIGPGGDPVYDWQETFEIDAIHRDLGFAPAISLKEGIARFVHALSNASEPSRRTA